ncbi:hypothetical protein D3C85_1576540 [compost metagenome]
MQAAQIGVLLLTVEPGRQLHAQGQRPVLLTAGAQGAQHIQRADAGMKPAGIGMPAGLSRPLPVRGDLLPVAME